MVGASPKANVRREAPVPGDVIVLLGGATGRDGIGGATGSSKAHTEKSVEVCGAEVQKGNPPTERKLQRLFRDPSVSTLIKRCNDFGAGGVCVAIGELAPGLTIDLNKVPKKYEGLDGTELAISESQERMAVVLSPEDVETFQKKAREENLDATVVAVVTEEPRLRMEWRGDEIVNITRAFLDTNGVTQNAEAEIAAPQGQRYRKAVPACLADKEGVQALKENMARLEVCCQKGLSERFGQLHRGGHGAHALRRQVPAHPRRGHGGQDPPAPRGDRRRHRHELRLHPRGGPVLPPLRGRPTPWWRAFPNWRLWGPIP